MPIETYTLPESMQLVVRILPSDNDPDTDDSQILSGFIESIPVIKRSASDRSLYFQTFSIAPPPRKQMLEIGKSAKSWTPPREFDPWNATTRAFWARVARNPDLHQQIKSWLDQVLHMLERVNKMGRATEGLWELDETQFAEPAISVLAIAHPDFVPYYARFLTVWDMHHEVTQKDVISQIFATHGITEATENLLIARIVDGVGQYGYDNFHEMLPLLQEHYGKIEGTDFYKRMAAYHHAASVSSYARVLQNKFDNYRSGILRLPLIEYQWNCGSAASPNWQRWAHAAGLQGTHPEVKLHFSEEINAIDSALAGQGAVLASSVLTSAAVSDGQLVRLSEADLPGRIFWAVIRNDHPRVNEVEHFTSWARVSC